MSRLLTSLLAFLFAASFIPVAAGAAPPATKGGVLATDWKETVTARKGQLMRSTEGPTSTLTYTSVTHNAGQGFNAVGPHWKAEIPKGATVTVHARTSVDGKTWQPWQEIDENHGDPGRDRDGRSFGNLVVVELSRYAQYKVVTMPSPKGVWPHVSDVTLTFIDSSAGPDQAQAVKSAQRQSNYQAFGVAKPAVISRAGWGADESLRYDANGKEVWEKDYLIPTKAIIHDTTTVNNDPNPPRTMRSIYYYHAITRGWGDIGYNYLVDEQGNIYEGRAGGENVVGGHTRCYNWGSLGISALGDHAKVRPSDAMVQAFERIIAWQFDRAGIDPHGHGTFMRWHLDPAADTNNIMAHIDASRSTYPCGNDHVDPGPYLYNRFPEIRDEVLKILGYRPTPNPVIQDVTFTPTTLNSGASLRMEVTIQNAGTGQMDTQGPAPSTVYAESENWAAKEFGAKIAGKYRVTLDSTANTSGAAYPYRWGLGLPLLPGQTKVVAGYVTLPAAGSRTFWVGLNQELVKTVISNTGRATVTVVSSGAEEASRRTILDAKATPAALSPNGDGRADSTVITYRLASAQNSKVELYTASGEWVKTVSPWTPTGTTTRSVPMSGAYYDVFYKKVMSLPTGQYKVAVMARDAAGAVTQAEVPLTVDSSKPQLSTVRRAPANISPNGDGRQDSTRLSGEFSEPVSWSLELLSPAGAVVRNYAGSGSSFAAAWNGRDASGRALPDGVYSYRLNYGDAAGNTGDTRQGTIRVDTIQPRMSSVTSGEAGVLQASYYLSERSYVTVTVTNSAGEQVAQVLKSAQPSGRNTATWNGVLSDGSAAPAGAYTWNVFVRDLAGNRAAAYPAKGSFQVGGGATLVDNVHTGFSASTNWQTGSFSTPHGSNYRFRLAEGSATDAAVWTAGISSPGTYDVYVWYTDGTNRATNATYTVGYAGGARNVVVNQQSGGQSWRLLGTFSFDTGAHTVRLSAPSGSGGYLIADAVKWVKR